MNSDRWWEQRLPRGEINYAVHILPRKKLIYVNNCKAACSTLKATLWQWETENRSCVFSVGQVHRKLGSPFKSPSDFGFERFMLNINSPEYTRICYVRNPYHRLLSCYLEKIAGTGRPVPTEFRKELGLPLHEDVTFATFVGRIESHTPYEADRHWRMQTEQLLWGDIQYDFTGRVESFSRDLDRLGEECGVHLKGYFSERRIHAKGAYRPHLLGMHYTEDLRSRVYDMYRADFDAFGYSEVIRDLDDNEVTLRS